MWLWGRRKTINIPTSGASKATAAQLERGVWGKKLSAVTWKECSGCGGKLERVLYCSFHIQGDILGAWRVAAHSRTRLP